MKTILFVPLLVIYASTVPFDVSGSEQKVFYNLHQAANLLEQFSRGECKDNMHVAMLLKKYLIKADAEFGEVIANRKGKSKLSLLSFELELHELWDMYNHREQLSIYTIEEFRVRIHEKATKMKLQHQNTWHEDLKFCDNLGEK